MSSLKKVPAVFFRTAAGREAVRDWLKALPVPDRKAVGNDIRAVEFGWPLGMPLVRPLSGGLHEIRTRLPSRRIALAPIIILAFGIGDASKIVTAWLVVVFLVFFNTFEGARSVDRDHINAARLLGAGEWQVTRTVIVPSTMAWLFASLTPAVSFSLIGVIVGEFIGAEHGIGRMIIESEARGEAAGMMVAVFVLMIVGVILASIVRRVQAYLLRWRPAQNAAAT